MAAFLSAAMAAIGSSSIGGAIVRIIIAYGISRLINKGANDAAGAAPVDQGNRLQLSPDTTNPIPLLFGSAFYGGRITDAQLVDQNKTMWYCLTLSEVPTLTTTLSGSTIKTNIDKVYLDNQLVTFKSDGITVDYITNEDEGTVNTSHRDLIKIYLYEKGSYTPTLPSNFFSGGSPISPAVLPGDARTLFPDWGNDQRMVNLTFALVKITYNRDKGITSLPDFQFQVSNNLYKPGDAIYSYMRNSISGADLPVDNIDTASLTALNDYSDDTVSFIDETDGQTKTLGNRYQINGLINPQDNVLANLQKLATNAGSFLNYDISTGKWGVVINRDAAATLHFDDSNIISGIDLTGTNLDNLYNSVKVEFPHYQIRDQIDTITIDLPDEFRNANEPDNELTLKLDLLNEPLQARELAYLELYQNRMDQMVTFTTDYSKINTESGDVITITSSVYGWTDKTFRVIRVREVEGEDGGLAVEITAQEYDSTMYSAGGVPRRPRVPSKPIDIPSIDIIGTPSAPTYVEHNSIAVPYVSITGVVPSGIVDIFEFWASSTAGYADSTFTLLGTISNSNGAPYTQGDSLTFSAPNLDAGTYKFKVRAGNEKAYGPYSNLSTELTWAPVQVTDQVDQNTNVSPGPDLVDLLPILGMGALAYFAYKALYPEALAALSNTELGKLLGLPTEEEVIAQKAKLDAQSNPFQQFIVGDDNILSSVTPTVTLVAGDGMTITADGISGEITFASEASDAIKTITADGVAVSGATNSNVTLTHGAGIRLDTVAETNTITISYDGSVTEPSNDFNTGKALDFGEINKATNTYVMDDCRQTYTMPPKLKRESGTYLIKNKYVTGGSTYTDNCYSDTMPTLIIPQHGWTVVAGHPKTGGYFVPPYNSSYPQFNGKRIYYRVITPAQVVAYCDFDDQGNTLPTNNYCSLDPASRPTFSTYEFPAGHRFVTYDLLYSWTLHAGGYGIPISMEQYENTPRQWYDQNYEVTRQPRICQNADGSEPSLVIS